MHIGRYPWGNHVCNFLWRSVKGFGRGMGSNFPFSRWLASSPLQHSRIPCECVIFSLPYNLLITIHSNSILFLALCYLQKLAENKKWKPDIAIISQQFGRNRSRNRIVKSGRISSQRNRDGIFGTSLLAVRSMVVLWDVKSLCSMRRKW